MAEHITPRLHIRYACEADNFKDIARCIYMTDPFIYPSAFGPDIENAAHAITKLMTIQGNLFDYRRLIVATIDDQIKGILMYSEPGTTWNQQKCNEAVQDCIPSMRDFQYVSKNYFSEEVAISQANHVEIVACCVAPDARQQGLAKRMFQCIIAEKQGCTMTLDVLAENQAAIALYSKCGFAIASSYKGFSMPPDPQPNCYHMVHNVK